MTAHPGTNKAIFEVTLARPRNIKTTGMAEFAELSYSIWEALKDEVKRAMEVEH